MSDILLAAIVAGFALGYMACYSLQEYLQAKMIRRILARHHSNDPHCTCNDCIELLERQFELYDAEVID